MVINDDILITIKDTVRSAGPNATVIYYGSFARGDNQDDSDIDLFILIDKEKLTGEEEKKIKYRFMKLKERQEGS